MESMNRKFYQPYRIMLAVYGILLIFAFIVDTPKEIFHGFIAILNSKSLLVTDYMAIGGVGATLLNAVVIGCVSICLLITVGVKPNGATIMGLWFTTGFAFFGKNLFNMIPITTGVWLFAKVQKEPFIRYNLVALMSATISPIVSEISFLYLLPAPFHIIPGILIGVLAGFLFPIISAFCVRVHDGYSLYNMGFAGGLISTFLVAMLSAFGIEVESTLIWSSGNNVILAILLYMLSLFLIICGIVFGEQKSTILHLKEMVRHPGRLATDFYILFGQCTYINMGLLGALGTTIVLLVGGDLNGPTLSGILAMVGCGCFGKHLKNVWPLLVGSILGTFTNQWDMTSPSNMLAILFSTGLAPIAGQFGPAWGIVAGFIHVNLVIHIRFLNNGLNLYNNGYAGAFVALFLVPIIITFRKERP